MKNLKSFFIVVTLLISSQSVFAGANKTPDWFRCVDKYGSSAYNYGDASYSCNASSFGDDAFLYKNFSPLIYNHKAAASSERPRYMQELNAVIRDAATLYIKRRKPAVTDDEVKWWILAIQAVANQETRWTHYRLASTDSRLKMMRGDLGHGHGLLQIDDRWHYADILSGKAWSVMTNLTFGMDIYYEAWQKAANQSCIGSPTNYSLRLRAAWSAFNGGLGSICRFSKTGDSNYFRDVQFNDGYKKQGWTAYIANPSAKPNINVPCLMEKNDGCAAPTVPPVTPSPRANILYRNPSGSLCVFASNKFSCVKEDRDLICLRALSSFTSEKPEALSAAMMVGLTSVFPDRHQLCHQLDPALLAVGTTIETLKPINFRTSAGGPLITLIPERTQLEILDFELQLMPLNKRYYKVHYANKDGFIYAGQNQDPTEWVGIPAPKVQWLQVVNSIGINLRDKIDGLILVRIPAGTQLQILETNVKGDLNEVYYKVTYRGQTGWMYSGQKLPKSTTALWTKLL